MIASACRRPPVLAVMLLLAGTSLAVPAAAQEAPPAVKRNVGGYPVSAPASAPQPLVQPVAPTPAGSVPAAPARAAAPVRTEKPKPHRTTAPKPAATAPAHPPARQSPAPAAPPAGTPPAPPLRRTTSEAAPPPADMRIADARPLAVAGLRASTLPAAAAPVVSTARSDAPVATGRTGSKWRVDPKFLPTVVAYDGPERPGTIIIDTDARFLYLVEADGQARRYGVGVGRPGFEWAGKHRVTRKAEWPDWRPPPEMRARQPKLPAYMPGGPRNPLGARALYLGSTLYRIHGSNEPWSIGRAVSSGCIRMRNEDVTDLYDRVPVGTTVIVH